MSGNSNLSCVHHRWNLAIDTYFSTDHVVEIDLEATRCVFRLPKTTTQTSPDAYAPHRLGLGPYHHLRPDFYKMQLHKIAHVRSFLGPNKLEAFKEVVAGLVRHEPIVRACYDEFLDFDIKTLATILAVDALYLLQFLDASKNGEISDEMVENLAADILMVENQIPVVLFKVVLMVLQLHDISSPERVLSTQFRDFCEAHSPLELDKTQCEWMDRKQLHLLDRIYHSIVTNRAHHIPMPSSDLLNGFAGSGAATTIIGFTGLQAAAPPQILAMVERARKIREKLKDDAEVASSPTAFELSETAGVRFERTPGGIRDIMYYVDRNALQLPSIKIDGNSEIVLRNLLAYEAASATAGATLEMAEYLDVMCGLIRTDRDVVILKKAEIIKGEVSEEGVVGVFDGIGRLMGDSRKNQSKLIVEMDVSKSYNEVGGGVKVTRFVKKCVSVGWRFLVLVAAVAVLVVLVMQAFCSVFACGSWFGISAVVRSLLNIFYKY